MGQADERGERIDVEGSDRITVVRPYGEMDISRAPSLQQALRRALARGVDVVVDLQHLTFCDSSGLNALLTARTEAAAEGRTLYLAAPTHQVVQLLKVTGAETVFSIDPAPPIP
ncbi:STAS domain-containing protein [Streptomyces sp. NPDC029003]|uniref:STAS domain-containing protein n=1 Tax=Streptomyces sp. NPDC029003 TaxID=3155125 RepID=UPI0033CAE0EE